MIESRQIVLKCESCRVQKSFTLNMTQVRKLSEGSALQLHCSSCSSPQHWMATEPIPAMDSDVDAPAKAKNILLVDDDDLILKLLQKVLETWNAKIEISTNGKEALAKLATRSFDLVICDLQMPEMSGQELFQHIQENALISPSRIIFLTGDKRDEAKSFLDGTGCNFLYKPIQFLDFSGHIQEMLNDDLTTST